MSKKAKQPSFLLNLVCNILLPVMILEKGEKIFGAGETLTALAVALFIPLAYAGWDYYSHKHKNYVSLIGAINVLGTGGLALMELEGIWFAIKEAFFPFILGCGVVASGLLGKPFFSSFIQEAGALDWNRIEEKARELSRMADWKKLMQRSNNLFAMSFFISSALNFALGLRIFQPIDPSLSNLQRSQILNEQISQMTWQGYLVIALPLLIFMMLVFWQLLSGIRKITGFGPDDIMAPQAKT